MKIKVADYYIMPNGKIILTGVGYKKEGKDFIPVVKRFSVDSDFKSELVNAIVPFKVEVTWNTEKKTYVAKETA